MELPYHKGSRCRPPEKRGKVASVDLSISDRPEEVKDRQIFGHWELDSIVSSRGKSRLYTALKMQDRSSDSMQKAIKYLCSVAWQTGLK